MCHFEFYFLLSTIHPVYVQSTSFFIHISSSLQDGWTAVLAAARCGHKEVVQELCETFEADVLHRKKVRFMWNISGNSACTQSSCVAALTG